MRGEIEPMLGKIETSIRKLGNSEKLKFPFWVMGPLVMIFGGVGVGAGRPDGGGGGGVGGLDGVSPGGGSRRDNGREPDGAGQLGPGGPDGREGGDDREHEGQMAVAGGVGAEGGWWDRRAIWQQVVGAGGHGREPG